MKQSTMLIILSGIAAFLLLKAKQVQAKSGIQTNADMVTEILNEDNPGQPAYGWRYFSNGVAISPNGIYYKNGVEVWRP